jgi:hypothetical protein
MKAACRHTAAAARRARALAILARPFTFLELAPSVPRCLKLSIICIFLIQIKKYPKAVTFGKGLNKNVPKKSSGFAAALL